MTGFAYLYIIRTPIQFFFESFNLTRFRPHFGKRQLLKCHTAKSVTGNDANKTAYTHENDAIMGSRSWVVDRFCRAPNYYPQE